MLRARHHSCRSASMNAIVRSTLPVEPALSWRAIRRSRRHTIEFGHDAQVGLQNVGGAIQPVQSCLKVAFLVRRQGQKMQFTKQKKFGDRRISSFVRARSLVFCRSFFPFPFFR
jgi:hypothetical protein